MSSLYTETKELMEFRKIAEYDELPEEVISNTIEGMSEGFDNKAVALYQVTEEMDSDILVIDDMIAKLSARKKHIISKQKNMRSYLLEAMQNTGVTKISCPYFTISLSKTPAPLVIESEPDIPDEFMVVKSSIVPDKREITKRLRGGDSIPGCHLGEQAQSIRIKR